MINLKAITAYSLLIGILLLSLYYHIDWLATTVIVFTWLSIGITALIVPFVIYNYDKLLKVYKAKSRTHPNPVLQAILASIFMSTLYLTGFYYTAVGYGISTLAVLTMRYYITKDTNDNKI